MPVLKSSAPCPGAVCTAPVPGVERDVLAEHADRIAVVQRMAEADALELLALHPRDRPIERRGRRPAATAGASASATITARPSTS